MIRRNLSRIKQNYRREKKVDRVLRKRRGQFVVVAALLISIITLSIALSIHRLSLERLQLRYEPVEELVMGLTSDLDRCLTHALSRASQKYYASFINSTNEETASDAGLNFISQWLDSVITSYSTLGLRISMNAAKYGGKTDVFFHLNWGIGIGISRVSTEFLLDIDSYDFEGLTIESNKYVWLRLNSAYFDYPSVSLNFTLMEGKNEDKPIPNLSPKDLIILVCNSSGQELRYLGNESKTELRYLGGGNYTLTFNHNATSITKLSLFAITPFDKIYVMASTNSTESGNISSINITLMSQEATSSKPTNRGWIQLGDPPPYNLPITIPIKQPGEYILKYIPENNSYSFLNWTVMGQVEVRNSSENPTNVNIKDNGTIIAFYKEGGGDGNGGNGGPFKIYLSSIEENGRSENLGNIILEGTLYPLPNNTTRYEGNYSVEYVPKNFNYQFLYWTSSGGVIPWNSTKNDTNITLVGNGSLTAVYQFNDDWSKLYVDKGGYLHPISMLSGFSSHIPSWASTGKDKQIIELVSPQTPMDIFLDETVNLTLIVRPNPPSEAKDMYVELGYNTTEGNYIQIGNVTVYDINRTGEGIYKLQIITDPTIRMIPQGSTIIMNITMTFISQGTFFLYYGPKNPSNIELYTR